MPRRSVFDSRDSKTGIALAFAPLRAAVFGLSACRFSSTPSGAAGSPVRPETIAPPAARTCASPELSAASSADRSSADVIVDPANVKATVSRDEVDAHLAIWYGVTHRNLPAEIASVRPRILRWPGGSTADTYHWKMQTECSPSNNHPTCAYDLSSTFDNFMHDIVIPGHYDVAITINYGSSETCTGGGDPKETAAWVAYARRKGYHRYIKYGR